MSPLRWLTSAAWFPVLVSLLPAISNGAEREWQKLTAPRFTIVSHLSEKETRAWAEEFDQFLSELIGFLHIESIELQPVTVVLFRTQREFAPYRMMQPNGQPAKVAGVFASRKSWGVIGLSRGGDAEWIRRVILHEGFHWIASHDRSYYPLWVAEGLAEVFSTFHVARGNVQWGEPIESHLQAMRRMNPLPLGRLLRAGSSDPLFNESDRTGIFYAQSWALAHYLIFGDRKNSSATLSAYLKAVRSGMSIDEIIRAVFGTDEAKLQSDLDSYLSRGKAFRVSRPAPEDMDRDFVVAVATPGEVAAAQARLALGTGNLDLAREQALEALQLEPQMPAGHEVLAWLESELSRQQESGAYAERAINHGSRDPWMYLFFVIALEVAENTGASSSGELARAVSNLMEQALNLQTDFGEAYQVLAAQMADVDPLRPSDRDFLLLGNKRFPNDGRILMGLAFIAEREEDYQEVTRLLRQTESPSVDLSGWARGSRDLLRRRNVERDLESRVLALIDENKTEEALTLYDEAIESTTDAFLERKLRADRLRLALTIKIETARAARRAGLFDEAQRHYEEILRWPDLSRSQRSQVNSELRTVERQK